MDWLRDFFSDHEHGYVAWVRIWVVFTSGVVLFLHFFEALSLSVAWREGLRWVFLIWLVAEIGHQIVVSWEKWQDRKELERRWQ